MDGRTDLDGNVIHVENRVDPVSDIATVTTELCLKDLDTVQKRAERARKAAKGYSPIEKLAGEICGPLAAHLDAGKPARSFKLPDHQDAPNVLRDMQLLTAKPTFYIANVDEASLANLEGNAQFRAMRDLAASEGAPIVPVCAALESQIAELEDPKDRAEFLESAGLKEPGLNAVIRAGYTLLNFLTFFTAGKTEVRAWTTKKGARAPKAAGVIHTDFEKGFIKAEVIWWEVHRRGQGARRRQAGDRGQGVRHARRRRGPLPFQRLNHGA